MTDDLTADEYFRYVVTTPRQPRAIPPPGQRPQFAVYARKETTTDSATKDMLKAMGKPDTLNHYKDVVIYREPEATHRIATIPWHHNNKPNIRSKWVTLDCLPRPLYWIPDKRMTEARQQYRVKIGEIYWFEYHCNESHDSAHAELWYRSHQQVKVLKCVEAGQGRDESERADNAASAVFRIQFSDGFTHDAFEDELMEDKAEFNRPAPPPRPTAESLVNGLLETDIGDESPDSFVDRFVQEKGLVLPELARLNFTMDSRVDSRIQLFHEKNVPRYWFKVYVSPKGQHQLLNLSFTTSPRFSHTREFVEVGARIYSAFNGAWQHDGLAVNRCYTLPEIAARVRRIDAIMRQGIAHNLPAKRLLTALGRMSN